MDGESDEREGIAVNEVAPWRQRCYQRGRLLVLLNPFYFLLSISLISWLHMSDLVFAWLILIGVLVGLTSLVFGILAKAPEGWLKWALIVVACGETFFWWFMSVGL
jgi:hypothetical protein